MIHVTCRLTAKNRDQLRNPTLGSRVWATFTFTLNIAVDERLQTSEIRLRFIQLKRWPFVALKIGGTTVNYHTLESVGYAYSPKITLMLPVSTPCSACAIVSWSKELMTSGGHYTRASWVTLHYCTAPATMRYTTTGHRHPTTTLPCPAPI